MPVQVTEAPLQIPGKKRVNAKAVEGTQSREPTLCLSAVRRFQRQKDIGT